MQPLVSILIPCFNAEDFVAQAIDSALAQTRADIEVIVVDDGSTDGSLDVIRRYEARIRWETGPNRGANAARNRLLEMSRGTWLQYLDADDYLRLGKIRHQLDFIAANPASDVVYSPVAAEWIERDGQVLKEQTIPEPRDPWILLAHWDLSQTGGALWRKTALQGVGGWRTDQPCCQEHELYFRLLAAGARFGYCDGPCLAVYRIYPGNNRLSNRLYDEVYRQRLLILDRIEKHLKAHNELSAARHNAINDTRHAAARMMWRSDRSWARDIARTISSSDPNYYPWRQPASPLIYSLVYRALGFQVAQRVAALKRALSI